MSTNQVPCSYSNCNAPLIYREKFMVKTDGQYSEAMICFVTLPVQIDSNMAADCLHSEELDYFTLVKHEKRKRSFLLGRCSAKQAIMALTGESDPKKILIRSGVLGQPVIKYFNKQDIQVSITHCDNLGAAIGYLEDLPMGIDIEKVNPNKTSVLESQMTVEEKDIAKSDCYPYNFMLTVMWTVKEALSKILRTGITTSFTFFEISSIEVERYYIVSYFRNFSQYKAISFALGNYVCSVVYPKNVELDIDLNTLKQKISIFE